MPSSHLILCRPLLLLPPIPPSIRVLQCFKKSSNGIIRFPLEKKLTRKNYMRKVKKMKVKSLSSVQLFVTPRTDCSLPGSSIHGIFQAGILEWVAISFSRGTSWHRDWTQASHVIGRCFTVWATREARSHFYLFILFMEFSRQECCSGLPFSSSEDYILSELSTMTCLSWVALHSMAHSFIELHKPLLHDRAVIYEGERILYVCKLLPFKMFNVVTFDSCIMQF